MLVMNPLESSAQLSAIARQVFSSMAGMDVTEGEDLSHTAFPFIAQLRYGGGAEGIMAVECNGAMAVEFASRFMSIALGDLSDSDIEDALGELVNMVGGNLKGMMPADTEITIPVMLSRPEMERHTSQNDCVTRDYFRCADAICCVSLWIPRKPA